MRRSLMRGCEWWPIMPGGIVSLRFWCDSRKSPLPVWGKGLDAGLIYLEAAALGIAASPDDLAQGVGAPTQPTGSLPAHILTATRRAIHTHGLRQRQHQLPLSRRKAMRGGQRKLTQCARKANLVRRFIRRSRRFGRCRGCLWRMREQTLKIIHSLQPQTSRRQENRSDPLA